MLSSKRIFERCEGMQYNNIVFESDTKKYSKLVYGTGNNVIMGEDEGAAIACMDLAWENGFTIYDTAYAYGNAEKNIGKWMALRGHREEMILMDKGCNPGQKGSEDIMSAELIRGQNEESLERLQTDYVDFYVLHRDEPGYPVGEIIDVLNALKEEGKIHRFGVSNWSLERLQEANSYAKSHGLAGFSVYSPAYSLAELSGDPWGRSVTLSGRQNADARKWCQDNHMPVFPYSSLARGFLSGKFRTDREKPIEECLWWAPIEEYDTKENRERLKRAEKMADEKGAAVSQIALAWLLRQPLIIYPIVSPSSDIHMKENIRALDISLTQEECKWLLEG